MDPSSESPGARTTEQAEAAVHYPDHLEARLEMMTPSAVMRWLIQGALWLDLGHRR